MILGMLIKTRVYPGVFNYCVGRDGVQSRVLMHCLTALAEILAGAAAAIRRVG
jgi:hypothetical protein